MKVCPQPQAMGNLFSGPASNLFLWLHLRGTSPGDAWTSSNPPSPSTCELPPSPGDEMPPSPQLQDSSWEPGSAHASLAKCTCPVLTPKSGGHLCWDLPHIHALEEISHYSRSSMECWKDQSLQSPSHSWEPRASFCLARDSCSPAKMNISTAVS